MNINENYSTSDSVTYAKTEEELFRSLMPQLGIDPAVPTRRYRRKMWIRYLVPRIALLLVVCVLWTLFIWWFSLPSEVNDLTISQDLTGARVEFSISRRLILDSITATLDRLPVPVDKGPSGKYLITADRNGELVITTQSINGEQVNETVSITGIDEQAPHVSRHAVVDGCIRVYLTDDDGTGVNWDSLRAVLVNTGESLQITGIDRDEGFFSLPHPPSAVRIHVEDMNGNGMSMLLEPTGGDPEDTPDP